MMFGDAGTFNIPDKITPDRTDTQVTPQKPSTVKIEMVVKQGLRFPYEFDKIVANISH